MRRLGIIAVLILAVYFLGPPLLGAMGSFLIKQPEETQAADAVVVLSTGVDYYPRLMEAARLYRAGLVKTVVINGNRKSETYRRLESSGFTRPLAWWTLPVAILEFLEVKHDDIRKVSAPDAYDTVSEATVVGAILTGQAIDRLIVTTSKFHSRRAHYIWQNLYGDRLNIQIAPAAHDPFDAHGWWKEGRQIRQLLAEYGAWLFYWYQRIMDG